MRTPLFVLLRKDFLLFFRNRAGLILTFVVPFIMIWVFGQVFGLTRSDEGPSGIRLAVVNQSSSPAAKAWVDALAAEKGLRLVTTRTEDKGRERPLTEADLRPAIEATEFNFALVIPPDFLSSDRFGLRIRMYSNPRNEVEVQMVNGLLQKNLFSQARVFGAELLQSYNRSLLGDSGALDFNEGLAALIAKQFGGTKEEALARLNRGDWFNAGDTAGAAGTSGDDSFFSRLLTVETEQVAGKDVKAPTATRLVSGFAVQFLLFALSAGATALLQERDQGLYHRLLAAPVARHHILISRYAQGVAIGVLQLTLLFVAAQLLYGVDVLSHYPLLFLVALFASAACASFGMLIASFATTIEAASGLSTLTILTMSAVGGAWFPLWMMPEFMQTVAKFTIVYWAMHGFDLVLWNQTGLLPLLKTLGLLATIASVVMAVAVVRFSRSRLFG